MGKQEVRTPTVYECVEPFTPAVGPSGVPEVYGYGHQVLEGHPILKRFGRYFEPVTDRVLRREQATLPAGVQGEPRSFTATPQSDTTNDTEETNDAQV